MSDYGTFMSNEYSRGEDEGAARELATDRAIRQMDKLSGKPRMEYAIDLVTKGGVSEDDIADALCGGGSKSDWEAISAAFEEGAWQEYLS